jgi:hypothetical protein
VRKQFTKSSMIATLVALAVLSLAAIAEPQDKSGRAPSDKEVQKGSGRTTIAAPGRLFGILVSRGDESDLSNPSIYYHGIKGRKTPNVDRLAREGVIFTDWYSRQSCTSGRATFITGQYPIHEGLAKPDLPGDD